MAKWLVHLTPDQADSILALGHPINQGGGGGGGGLGVEILLVVSL